MQLSQSNWIRVAFVAMIILFQCPSAFAQEPQIDALANQMAAALSQAKLKTVMVFDFVGQEDMDALGQRLAADFRSALAKSASGIQVEDRAKLFEVLQQRHYGGFGVGTAETACWLLQQTSVEVRS